jgi:hypothetical protein
MEFLCLFVVFESIFEWIVAVSYELPNFSHDTQSQELQFYIYTDYSFIAKCSYRVTNKFFLKEFTATSWNRIS